MQGVEARAIKYLGRITYKAVVAQSDGTCAYMQNSIERIVLDGIAEDRARFNLDTPAAIDDVIPFDMA